jgi:hypothetical protein
MERIYENSGFTKRTNISLAVLVLVFFYGLWELYSVFLAGRDDPTGALFGVLFVGGALYGAKTLWDEGRDLVTGIDADFAANKVRLTLWRPLSSLAIDATPADFARWGHRVKVIRKGMNAHYFLGSLPNAPGPLMLELKNPSDVPAGLRRLMPAAVEELEEKTGRKADANSST